MNYYERYVGDFQRDTGHLSCAEIGVYDRLLDHYYAIEAPLPADNPSLCRIARAMEPFEQDAVRRIADEFFPVGDDGLRHNTRADREIHKAQRRIHAAKENGKKGGRPPKTNQKVTQEKPNGFELANPAETHSGVHHTPYTNGKPSVSTDVDTGGEPPKITDPDEIIFGYGVPLLTNAGTAEKQARSFLGGLRKAHGDQALIDKLRDCLKEKPLQPLEWLAAALPPRGGSKQSRHAGFDKIDYRAGVTDDGRF